MTLKDKFNYICEVRNHNHFNILTDKLEQIADEFAIGFAEWLDTEEAEQLISDLKMVGELPKTPTNKELLEIYKKQKKL